MQEKLKNFVNKIKSEKDSNNLNTYDEATTKQTIVLPILNFLGWDIFDIEDVQPEYPVDPRNSNEKVDYALAKNTDSMVFVEVKAISNDNGLENYEKQICNYCFNNSVTMGILTNGISWWFYLTREKGPWTERKFYSIDLIQQDTDIIVSKFIDLLSKQNIISGSTEINAKKIHKSNQKNQIIKKSIPKAWNNLISSKNDKFMDMFNDTLEKISGYRAEPEKLTQFLEENKNKLLISEKPTFQTTARIKKFDNNSQFRKQKNNNYIKTGFTGKNIKAFIFNNKRYEVRSWIQLLLKLCEEINNLHKNDFDRVYKLKGTKRLYFSKNPNELKIPKKVNGTNIFVEAHFSAKDIDKLCRNIISLFGYNKNSLKIESS